MFIAFKIFSGFTKTATKSTETAKDLMQRLNEQMERTQSSSVGNSGGRPKNPTQRGRESLARKEQNSPWGDNGTFSPGGQVAAKYLKNKANSDRVASHKSPEQTGRRGRNIDKNRNRTDEWGARGDSGVFSGKVIVFLLVAGGIALSVLSRLPAG